MQHIDILFTGKLAGGTQPFIQGNLRVGFHLLANFSAMPLIDGRAWAFVDGELPDIDRLEICRRLRCDPRTTQAHITFVLQKDDLGMRRRALRAGADDHIFAPLDRTSLLDFVLSAHPQDSHSTVLPVLALGQLTIHLAAFQARWGGKAIPLMPTEFRLLRYLVEHPGRVFTRSQLITALGKDELDVVERTVDVWVGRLRQALRTAGAGEPLRTVRSLGYVFDEF